MKKGTTDILRLLDYEMTDAFAERRENAKMLGEKAGTKLLLPMAFMLLIVFVKHLFVLDMSQPSLSFLLRDF